MLCFVYVLLCYVVRDVQAHLPAIRGPLLHVRDGRERQRAAGAGDRPPIRGAARVLLLQRVRAGHRVQLQQGKITYVLR